MRRAVVTLIALYGTFLATVAVARHHARTEQAAIVADHQIRRYRTMMSGARTATPTELARLVSDWLNDTSVSGPLPTGSSSRLAIARKAAGSALVARARVVLATPGYLDPDERAFLSHAADSMSVRAAQDR